MEKNIRACIDRFIDKPLSYTHKGRNILSSSQPARLFILTSKKWPKRNLRVGFLDGTSEQKAIVEEYANEWTKYANLSFDFNTSDTPADIRITFNVNLGSFSFIGVDALSQDFNQRTMNLGWIVPSESERTKKSTIIHEFGHAIGCLHEHQHPLAGIDWNKEKVYEDLAQPPNEWPPEVVDHNLFERYDENITAFSKFDLDSIMIYPIPAQWTNDGTSYGFDKDGLSESDKFFIKEMYPS
jgi:hypothetical protein